MENREAIDDLVGKRVRNYLFWVLVALAWGHFLDKSWF